MKNKVKTGNKKRNRRWGMKMAALAILFIILFTYVALRPSAEYVEKAKAVVEVRQYWMVSVGGRPVLYFSSFSPDSTCQGIALKVDSVEPSVHLTSAVWSHLLPMIPWSPGRIVIRNTLNAHYNPDATALVARQIANIDSALKTMNDEDGELRYYLRVHDVQDEGYNMIADYHSNLCQRINIYQRALKTLQAIHPDKKPMLQLVSKYSVLQTDSVGNTRTEPCKMVWAKGGKIRLRAKNHLLHKNATSIWRLANAIDTIVGKDLTPKQPIGTPQEGVHAYKADDGSYYEGDWEQGKRNGFGFAIQGNRLRVGEWIDDVYKGERLTYTTQRIYGIDISKYQHEIGKKKYAIQWNRLRINHLGTISQKRIDGDVDYPISFVYIKSTEGTTIRNAYFANDYTQARRNGIRTGAYHFFSIRSSGKDQAQYFLKNTRFNKGDLPPVLDVEPSNAQIQTMGGDSILFSHIRTWMKLVEQQVGVRPILYVNQMFVNNHLSQAPDIKRDYDVWIARYGEYKPDVRLSIWQLCPDGRVTGIQGAVDINVFNGYQSAFEEFLSNSTIP